MWFPLFVLATACAIASHGAACRLDIGMDRVSRFLAVGSVIGLALLVFLIDTYGILSVETFAAALSYAFACELYIFLFTLVSSSISANLLMTLYDRELTAAEIDDIYDSERMVAQRIRRLLATGFLRSEASGLTVTPKGMRLQKLLRALYAFFGHGGSVS
jgi:hypothetical protein